MIRDSVSVIFQCDDEFFLIKRQNTLHSFPGYTAFPGGKIDKDEDISPWLLKFDAKSSIVAAARREMIEELGYDFALDNKILSLTIIGEATSPSYNPKRFRNYYLLVKLTDKPHFKCCSKEIASFFWSSYESFIKRFDKGDLLCVKPMFTILNYLNEVNDFSYQNFRPQSEGIPMIEIISELIQIMPLSNTVPPAQRTNCFYINDLIIDPSPKDEDEKNKLVEILKQLDLKKIIISHHHPDHHQFANQIAKELFLPVYISEDSWQRISAKMPNYFDDIDVKFLAEGMQLTQWKGNSVRPYATPGHDEGHFGFAPDCLSWFIVGDLFQGIGTVVVGGPEGDMDKYLNSLQRVINLAPKSVIPSHGIPLGGVNILEKTYKHRLFRETQIIELLKQGHTIEQMLSTIYFDLPQNLHIYAKANIQSHIKRIKNLELI